MNGVLTSTTITSDGQKIYYDHYQYGHDKVIVVAHGFFNSRKAVLLQQLAQSLTDDYDVIMLDFRGHGQSSGLFYWTSKEYLDLEAILNFVHQKYTKIGVVGFSLSAVTSIICAAKSNLMDSLVAVSAPTEFEKIEFHFWQLDVENEILYNLFGNGRIGKGVRPGPFWLNKEKPIYLVSRISIPIFYIHGDRDWLIKPWHSKALYTKTNSPKRLVIIKNGPHAEYLIRKNKEETLRLIKGWFKVTLI